MKKRILLPMIVALAFKILIGCEPGYKWQLDDEWPKQVTEFNIGGCTNKNCGHLVNEVLKQASIDSYTAGYKDVNYGPKALDKDTSYEYYGWTPPSDDMRAEDFTEMYKEIFEGATDFYGEVINTGINDPEDYIATNVRAAAVNEFYWVFRNEDVVAYHYADERITFDGNDGRYNETAIFEDSEGNQSKKTITPCFGDEDSKLARKFAYEDYLAAFREAHPRHYKNFVYTGENKDQDGQTIQVGAGF